MTHLRRSAALVALNFASVLSLLGAGITREQAQRAAHAWLTLSAPSVAVANTGTTSASVVRDDAGAALFYCMDLQPFGFIVMAADDEVEPVLAYSDSGSVDLDADHPLIGMLRLDVAARQKALRGNGLGRTMTVDVAEFGPRAKWTQLLSRATAPHPSTAKAVGAISDIRVAPLLKSKWEQGSVGGTSVRYAAYNYYTPPYGPGNPNNYPVGCTATAIGQLMRFHRWPEQRVGAYRGAIFVDDVPSEVSLRGGDGAGGPYRWELMELKPGSSTPVIVWQAIGALLADIGTTMNMHYRRTESGAWALPERLVSVFQYADAAVFVGPMEDISVAVRTNLDAGLPALLAIHSVAQDFSHEVVCDGYGYLNNTLYHHLNMGWGGMVNVWYALPTAKVNGYSFDHVIEVVYNINPRVKGEIISGRVELPNGTPVAGVEVAIAAAQANGSSYATVTSNEQGIFAFVGLPSATRWVVSAQHRDYSFARAQQSVTTGTSGSESSPIGNAVADFIAESRTLRITHTRSLSGSLTLSAGVSDSAQISWQRNGEILNAASASILELGNVQPPHSGLYTATVTTTSATTVARPAIVGLTTTRKVLGSGREVGSDIYVQSNGNVFDQVLLSGQAASITADHAKNQITRVSYIDLDDDIVQVEMSGPGTLTIALDNYSGPSLPLIYNQDVEYVKGHAGIIITGATEKTNVSVFSVGRATAVNQSLFKAHAGYDGIADIAFIAIASANGKFGGVRTANANFFASRGFTGVYAPGVDFVGPVYIGNINAFNDAQSVLILGSAGSDTRITGGDLWQPNGRSVQVSGVDSLVFAAGSDSHGRPIRAQSNQARLENAGVDVTTSIVR